MIWRVIVVCSLLFFGIVSLFADENYVTVYNQNLGLIKQVRKIEIKQGEPLRFRDVAANLIPTSVHLRAIGNADNFRVLEQNFEYDLVNSKKILEKYIDHSIEVIKKDGELVTGTLLSMSGGSLVLQTGEGIKILPWNDDMSINVRELPEGLITRPTLIWEIAGAKSGGMNLEVSYLTSGMSWNAEYVGVLGDNSTRIDLSSWVSVTNNSGASYQDAHLKLVAGDIQRAQQPRPVPRMAKGQQITEFEAQQPFEERAFFEYHIYDLDRQTTIKQNQIKQITLFPNTTVSSEKKYYYNVNRDPEKVEVKVLFKNTEKSGLGKPLPAGVFRIYQKDKESLEFIGEDRIDHTPRNEEVKLTVGKAFDLRAERKIMERNKVSQRSERQVIEVELRNNKEKEDVVIFVEEYLNSPNYKIEESNFSYNKEQANKVVFTVPVKADSKATLRYTVLYSW